MDMWNSEKIDLKIEKYCFANALGDLCASRVYIHVYTHMYVCTHAGKRRRGEGVTAANVQALAH